MCNMTIEGGGRAGMIAPDETTFAWFEEQARPGAPEDLEAAFGRWRELRTDDGAGFDKEVVVDASALSPQVTWGTTPAMVAQVTGAVPQPRSDGDERALKYMGLEAGTPIGEIALDRVFIGSCTNSRIGDLRAAAEVVKGRRVASTVDAMVVPGSQQVAMQAEREGLDEVFRAAGFDWRSAGCSMCLGMNPDILSPGERCASTSNRNFEGRQGRGGRTHLVSPQMAAAAAIEGHFVDITGVELMEPRDAPSQGKVSVLDRADVDTDQIIPKQFLKRIERTGFGEFLFYDWAKEDGWDLPANPILVTGAELRLRLIARARAMGARGLRLQGDRGRELRRHLLLQLHQDRPAAGRAGGRGRAERSCRPARPRSTSRRARCASTGAPCRSSSTTTRASGCSKDSTTSRSRCSARRPSRPTSRAASGPARSPPRCSSSLDVPPVWRG